VDESMQGSQASRKQPCSGWFLQVIPRFSCAPLETPQGWLGARGKSRCCIRRAVMAFLGVQGAQSVE
jgi:hypothetical protein